MHLSGITKSSTGFSWGKGRKVTAAGWQVTLCDPMWYVISCSGGIISIRNCYISASDPFHHRAGRSQTPVPRWWRSISLIPSSRSCDASASSVLWHSPTASLPVHFITLLQVFGQQQVAHRAHWCGWIAAWCTVQKLKQDNMNGHVKWNMFPIFGSLPMLSSKIELFYPHPVNIQITEFGAFFQQNGFGLLINARQ